MTTQETVEMTPPDLETLYNDGYRKIVGHLRRQHYAPLDLAESLAQKTFVKAASRLDTLREPEKALAWLRKIATNLFNDYCRKAGPFLPKNPNDVEEAGEPEPELEAEGRCLKSSPEIALIEDENRSWFDAIASLVPMVLPPNQRRAMLLRYTEDLSYAEIGGRLGMSEATARTHVKRARQRLEALATGKASKVRVRPFPALQEQAEARMRAGDRVGAAKSHSLAGWIAAGAVLDPSDALRQGDPEGRILEDPACRDSEEAVAVRRLLAVAREEVSKAVEIFEAAGLHQEAAGAWLGLGIGYHHAELYEDARPALLAALAELRKTGRTDADHLSDTAFVLQTLGCVCTGLSLFEEGLKSFKRALRIFRRLGDEEEAARTLMQGAELFVKQGNLGAARQAYRRALKRCRVSEVERELETFVRARLAFLSGC